MQVKACLCECECFYRRFSRLLLKSFIMSERKCLLTSINSALGVEFFNRVATTFRITGWYEARQHREWGGQQKQKCKKKKKKSILREETASDASSSAGLKSRLCGLFAHIKATVLFAEQKQRDGKKKAKQLRTILVPTRILNLDSGVGLRVGFVDHLSADLLGQNLCRERFHADAV